MLTSRRLSPALALVAALTVASLVSLSAPLAAMAGPATVTVRVEGLNGVTLLPQTQVTTTTAPIAAEGAVCPGTSAGGALYDATQGQWKVKNDGTAGIEIDGIDGLNFPAFAESPDAYWSFWLNNEFASQGACSQELESGAHIVFAAVCDAIGPDCPTSATVPDHFLTSSAPSATVVQVGTSVSVTLGSINTSSGVREATLPADVTITAGSITSSPTAQGVATLSFLAAGTYTLQARAPDAIPSDPYTICVHNGNDGTCGALGSSSSSPTNPGGGPVLAGARYTGPYAIVARATSVIDRHLYRRGRAPRVLAGTVTAHAAVSAVSLELRRRFGGHCSSYDGTRELFIPARCGHGRFFKVSSSASFSYLLPSALAPGRYVLDVEATDVAGNRTSLARGTSRIVFYVR